MEYSKYPRTPHLPWSKGATSDDKTLGNVSHFYRKNIVVTEKMDGENTTLYPDGYVHARSIDGTYHASRDWIKADWSSKSYSTSLHSGIRLCGENVFAKHSIYYNSLESYFYLFGAVIDNNFLSWKEVENLASYLSYPHPKVLYRGEFDVSVLKKLAGSLPTTVEGYVVRNEDQFREEDFAVNVAKCVRENHVQTDQHWMHSQIVKNKLKG